MKDSLKIQLQRAKAEKMNHEYGSYAYSIWSREVKRITKLLEES